MRKKYKYIDIDKLDIQDEKEIQLDKSRLAIKPISKDEAKKAIRKLGYLGFGDDCDYEYFGHEFNQYIQVCTFPEFDVIKKYISQLESEVKIWKHNIEQMSTNWDEFNRNKYIPLQKKAAKIHVLKEVKNKLKKIEFVLDHACEGEDIYADIYKIIKE